MGSEGQLDRHRPVVGCANPVDAQERRTRGEGQHPGEKAVRLRGVLGADYGAGLEPARSHVLAERAECDRLGHARLRDEGPAPVHPVEEPLGAESLDLAAHGHAGESKALRQLTLGRERRTRRLLGHERLQDLPQGAALGAVASVAASAVTRPASQRGAPWLLDRAAASASRRVRAVGIGDRGADHDRERACVEGCGHVGRSRVAALGEHGAVELAGEALHELQVRLLGRASVARVARERCGDRVRAGGARGEAGFERVHVRQQRRLELGGECGQELVGRHPVGPEAERRVDRHHVGAGVCHGARVVEAGCDPDG